MPWYLERRLLRSAVPGRLSAGNYDLVWQIAIALSLMAAVLNWPIREQPVERLREAQVN